MSTRACVCGCVSVVSFGLTARSPAGNLVVNGSFESGLASGDFRTVTAGDNFIAGWEVTNTSVDVITAPRWLAASGTQSIDLAGTPGPGGIRQTIPTVAGRSYRVKFALSSNDGSPGDKSVVFRWGKSTQTLLGGPQNTWKRFSFEIVADSNSTVIGFSSLSSGTAGGTVDDVSVTVCPADFDGDGFVTGDDFDAFALAFVAGSLAADVNGDGSVTGDDFDAFTSAFELGC